MMRFTDCPPTLVAQGVGECPKGLVATATMPEGEYQTFVSTLDFNGVPCDSPGDLNTYVATLGCVRPCITDLNDDGVTNVDDLVIRIGAWGACPQ